METIHKHITAFIVDDEQRSISNLENLIKTYCKRIKVIGSSQSSAEAIDIINEKQPNLLFSDINMPGIDGFELLKLINNINIHVVFVTAHDEFAIKAIKNNALGYLLKPISISELLEVERKVFKKFYSIKKLKENTGEKKIAFSFSGGYMTDVISNIIYLESESNYTYVHRSEGKTLLISKTLKHFEKELKDYQFIRVHNSFLVNVFHVKKFLKKSHIVMSNGEKIVLSRRRGIALEEHFYLLFKKL